MSIINNLDAMQYQIAQTIWETDPYNSFAFENVTEDIKTMHMQMAQNVINVIKKQMGSI